ncbi:MAG: radical SAM protein, partial [Candidatus Omnitrophica bacterium]|nr:radical SAM protein [Candidatus Omnitrophota bacterium]
VNILRKHFPKTPIILGGTYATLCYEHALKNIGCDYVFKTENLAEFFKLLNIPYNNFSLYSTLPAYENLYNKIDYIVFRTTWGCYFNCSYCAIKHLHKDFFLISKEKILEFIKRYTLKGVKHFVFYDEALLYNQNYIKELLRDIIKLNLDLCFHTPNALHLKFLDDEIAYLLKQSGFINPHFGLETLNPRLQKLWGDKVNRKDLIRGVNLLKRSGYKEGEFSVYLLLGYPKQNLNKLKEEIKFLHNLGVKVSLAEFSPVPKTKIFKPYRKKLSEPLLHNNSIFGFFSQNKIKEFWEIKNYVRELNRKFTYQ